MSSEGFEKDLVRDSLAAQPAALVEAGANHPGHGSQVWPLELGPDR